MNSKVLLAAAVLLIISVVIFVGRNESGQNLDQGKSVSDIDGYALTLNPDPEALPEGVNASDVHAKRVEDIPTTDGEEVIVFDLLPDGAVFQKPVPFELTYKVDNPSLFPLVIHTNQSSDEFVETTVDYDPDTKIAKIMGEVTHFSELQVVANMGFDVSATGGGEYLVGGSVPFTFTVRPNGRDTVFDDPSYGTDYYQKLQEGTTYDVGATKVGTRLVGSTALTPKHVMYPAQTGLAQTDTYTYSDTFWCEKEGSDSVWAGPISLQFTLFGTRRNNRGEFVEMPTKVQAWGGIGQSYTCKKPETGVMVQLPPPYLVICPDGTARSGNPVYDKTTIEPILDSEGNYIDSVTKQSVVCSGVTPGTIPPEVANWTP